MQIWRSLFMLFLNVVIGGVLVGCSQSIDTHGNNENDVLLEINDDLIKRQEQHEEGNIWLMEYAHEIGFSLDAPAIEGSEVNTTLEIKGSIEEAEKLNDDHIYLQIAYEGEFEDESIPNVFYHFIPVEEGHFSEEVALHHGEGEYNVRVHVSSHDESERESYYATTSFNVVNKDKEIAREIEYTRFGTKQGVELAFPEMGLSEESGSVYVSGEVPEDYSGDMVFVHVEQGSQNERVILPVEGREFSGDIPLYFGEGVHLIKVQTMAEEDELYYDAATFYVTNKTAIEYTRTTHFNQYVERGVTIDEPALTTELARSGLTYSISGEIDETVPGADDISHIIVTTLKEEDGEEVEAGYVLPVEDYSFAGDIYFRFGEGTYDVIINVPERDQQDQSMFYYSGIMKVTHEINDIEDKRSTLPSRGIEADHPLIIEKANAITNDIEDEREIAKAVYEFVATHVDYDVDKMERDTFNIGDSAVKTLKSGTGVCQDYAFLTVALLRSIGMEANYIEGDAGLRHAWVEVKVDGEWLTMDPTWGAGYVVDGEFIEHYRLDYFDPDPDVFAETHTRKGVLY
ncbi:transglutaminase domain-containing protein [Salipaludibacillus agaradhaerens]|uniref:transglutaminase domain-containing protein n=1 Tax=Salipaludibacillus agaradhaerens TaxID=76935 RepID=UPI000998330A|nr:transglutaminase-like domain-containing protein [Salipaludibacillus agaradhaerens]